MFPGEEPTEWAISKSQLYIGVGGRSLVADIIVVVVGQSEDFSSARKGFEKGRTLTLVLLRRRCCNPKPPTLHV